MWVMQGDRHLHPDVKRGNKVVEVDNSIAQDPSALVDNTGGYLLCV
jgi:hypothetical protein